MVTSNLGKLKSNANCSCCNIESWDSVIGSVSAQLALSSIFLIGVDCDCLETDLFFGEVYLQVVDFVLAFQDPFYAVEVTPQFLFDTVEGRNFKLNLWLSKTFKASISLEKIWFELTSKVDHVGTQRVEFILLSAYYSLEDLLCLIHQGGKQLFPLLDILLGWKIFKDVGDEREELLACPTHTVEDLNALYEEGEYVEALSFGSFSEE